MKPYKVTDLTKLKPRSIEQAIEQFITDCRISHVDTVGMFNQTIESIAQATTFATNKSNHFWVVEHAGNILAYALASITKDVDNKLCYNISQAYVSRPIRGNKIIKEWYQIMRTEAKKNLCKHILVPSSRSTKAYLRFLGPTWHKYTTILKEDI